MVGSSNRKSAPVEQEVAGEVDNDEENMDWEDEEGTRIDGIYIPPAVKPACTFDPNGPRLIITKIENHFFKSFAENKVLGPFCKCFNAIIGPNGSGKSNVIDSMLFVFGYRAAKIRSKKVSVLMHTSPNYQNIQSCTVSVHFAVIIDREGDDYDIVPGSEFVVSRTGNKDNSSFYELNGRRVQFKEIGVLLKSHGIDLDHNRFLILQGEVEQISMMKCKADNENETGMLEYLEDIIGTSRYKKPLVLLHERVEILSEQRTEKLNRLKLVEKELEELSKPMEEAIHFLKAENTVVRSKNFFYQKNILNIEDNLKNCDEEKNKISEEHKDLMDKLKLLADEKSEKEKSLQQESAKYEHLEKRKEKLKESFDKANNKDIQLLAEMSEINKNRKKTKELLAEERKKLEQYEKVPEKSKEGIAECEAKEEELSRKKEKFEEQKTKLLTNLRTETQELQEQKEVLETQLVELKKIVDTTKSAYSLAEFELKMYVSNEEKEQNKYETLKETFQTSKKNLADRSQSVAELKKKIPLTEKSLNGALRESDALREQEHALTQEIRKKRSHLEENRSAMQANKSRGKVLDHLMRLKQEGKCPGLLGRLGDLGAIDLKYDVAISTACGPLDNIVVDSVNTAEFCIEFLKKHDIGRATFIALEKQQHLWQYCNSRIKTPENVHRLFDLIKVSDDSVKPAFYYGLRDTLVANDLDQASRIAYGAQRFRVVTLGGDIIETTGTMSGGGKTVCRGRMGQSVSTSNIQPRDLEKVESEIETMEEQIRDIRKQLVNLENQINALQPELKNMKIDIEKFSIELKSLEEQVPQLAEQLKAQQVKCNSTKADPIQVKKLTDVVEKSRVEYDKAANKAEELQIRVNVFTKEIKDKTLGKMKTVDKEINETSKAIDKCKAEITRLKVAVKTAERNAKKSVEKIAIMEKDIENAETRLRQMKTEREEIESDASKLLTCIEEISQQLVDGEEEFAELKKQVASLTKKENKLKSEEVEIDQKIKTVDKKLSDFTAQIHQWHSKIAQLKLQFIPNETIDELKKYTPEEILETNVKQIERDLETAEHELKSAKPNLNAIQEYQQLQKVYIQRAEELEVITNKRTEMRSVYDKLRNQRKEEFLIGYSIIKLKLKEMYQMITLGGDADFEMVDSFDPFTEGIQFLVRPPKKSWKKMANLSGGEKTLCSLALVFALHYYKPSPLYVMDEIDAALDFKNVSIIGHYIKERTKNAQFIIISLRSNMFELCDRLVGIYKTYNSTKSVTIDPRKFDNPSKVDNNQAKHDNVANGASLSGQPMINLQINEDDISDHTFQDDAPSIRDDRVIDDSFMQVET